MSSNPLLPLQFPTPASLADLHEHLASDALDHLARRPPRILVARADGAGPESTSDPEASSPAATPGSSNGRGTVASFAKWTVVRPRRRRPLPRASPPSPPSPTRTSEPALGSRRLESGRAATEARQELDVGGSRQHHHHHEAEEEEEERGQQAESDDEREEWPASANREYLTAYDSAASTARREVMGSRPFLREFGFGPFFLAACLHYIPKARLPSRSSDIPPNPKRWQSPPTILPICSPYPGISHYSAAGAVFVC
ncbi:GNAT family acetyltransferase [Colletotrichum tofieldiae]|nr:GNAT family acetyltransferase [Colletotrichum tofieldiae]